jgi:flagellar L-ring protein FlgH
MTTGGKGRGHALRLTVVTAMMLTLSGAASADDLFKSNTWPSLVSDRTADKVGDSLTVLIFESSQATDASKKSNTGALGLSGRYESGGSTSDQVGVQGSYSLGNGDQTGHSGHMVARISVVVDEVLPNGDLHVSGEQLLNINGRKVRIFLSGRVRRADIASSNVVLSTSLADATIVYGKPELTRDEKAQRKRRLAEAGKP